MDTLLQPKEAKLYEWYERLMSAAESSPHELKEAWLELIEQIAYSGNRDQAFGREARHIPHHDLCALLTIEYEPVLRPGLYVKGAWTGDGARVQYVGIAPKAPLAEHFTNRSANEWSLAQIHSSALRALPESFSPRLESDLQRERRYLDVGISDVVGKSHRLQRAERYAKVGLDNFWYYFFPSPEPVGEALTRRLNRLQRRLIQLANAELFERWVKAADHAFPLLNKTHFRTDTRTRPNPYSPVNAVAYNNWLDGEWWEVWDKEVRQASSGQRSSEH